MIGADALVIGVIIVLLLVYLLDAVTRRSARWRAWAWVGLAGLGVASPALLYLLATGGAP